MATITGDMKKYTVTDPQGNTYTLDPVDSEARQQIEEAKNLQFDENFFTADETDDEVSIGLNGVKLGVDETLQFVQDDAEGIVLGVNTTVENGRITEIGGKAISAVAQLVDPTVDNSVLAGDSTGAKEWKALTKAPWGTVITDAENNPMLDENGNSIYDENEVELWTSFDGVNFGAERAVADIEGNPLNLTVAGGRVSAIGGKPLTAETALTDVNGDSFVNTYAKKTDIIPPLADGGLLNDGTTITVPNNARSFVSTSKSAIILEVNLETGEVPNFAIEIHSNQQTGITVKAVSPESTVVLKYSNAGGNIIEANKDYQLTCVGTCWTLAEFKRPSDATYDFGALNITFTDDVGSASVNNTGNYIRINEPVLVDSFYFDRVFTVGVPATLVFPFQLDDASKLTSGKLYEIADIVYDENKIDKFGAILSSEPISSVEPNHPYVYIPEAASFNITLGAGEQLLLVPTVDPTIRLEASSGLWLIHGTYTSTTIGNLPGFDPYNQRFYGYVSTPQGQYQAGDFAKVSANASLYLMRVCFERMFPLPEEL